MNKSRVCCIRLGGVNFPAHSPKVNRGIIRWQREILGLSKSCERKKSVVAQTLACKTRHSTVLERNEIGFCLL